MWQKIQAISSLAGASAIVASVIFAYFSLIEEISEIRAASRSESAVTYCNLFLSNETLNRMASDTFELSGEIGEEHPGVFDKKPLDEVNQMKEEVDIDIQDRRILRSLYQVANYLNTAISGVRKGILDEGIIRDCLSTQIVCFREKYHVRTGLLDGNKEMMDEWKEFIRDGDMDVSELCTNATEEAW